MNWKVKLALGKISREQYIDYRACEAGKYGLIPEILAGFRREADEIVSGTHPISAREFLREELRSQLDLSHLSEPHRIEVLDSEIDDRMKKLRVRMGRNLLCELSPEDFKLLMVAEEEGL